MNRLTTRPLLPIALSILMISGCNRPDVLVGIDEPTKGSAAPATPAQPSFLLTDATMKIDGVVKGGPINLIDETFTYLFVYLAEDGLFMISAEPFGPAQEAGLFVGPRLAVDHAGVEIEFESKSDILDEPLAKSAWVEFTPDFPMFAPGTRPADIVIGLADSRNQIPGFDRPR
ncbi:MAG: hypothetical protein KJO98_13515 [Rhodothermia bacterium]|nr:hypothetical protein [Rhodothermia bacterium]